MVHAGAFYWGDVMKQGRTIDGDVVTIKRSWGELKIDAQDEHLLNGHSIHAMIENGYRRIRLTREDKYIGTLSRLIMNPPEGMQVDHINHDPTDNRRSNMRICTAAENARNGRKWRTSKGRFKCVVFHDPIRWRTQKKPAQKPWRAYTRVMGKRIWLGYHATEIEAAMAYNRFAAKEFGEFACYNRFDECPVLSSMLVDMGGSIGSPGS